MQAPEEMNVTIELAEDLCEKARHVATDHGLSLSSLIADLLIRELDEKAARPAGLLASLSLKEGEDREFEIPRNRSLSRKLDF